jgi:hypothetical protein
MHANPYADLPGTAFWRSGVAEASALLPDGIYRRKWPIGRDWRIGAAGSCFAQHITRFMARAGYRVLDVEPPPAGLPQARHTAFGYATYSARYGNIYTVRQLLQLVQEAAGQRKPADIVWEKDGRFVDALRPAVEPAGLDTPEQVLAHRAFHLEQVRALFRRIDLFIFTLGLTEAWEDTCDGTVFPMAPGTIAGRFDPARHAFRNFGFAEVLADFDAFRRVVQRLRGKRPLRCLITVSPVPLTATASGQHVLPATTYSKSVLRAVAGQLAEAHEDIDYFPSYEIITNQAARSVFFEQNLRSVTQDGVETVMRQFFGAHGAAAAPAGGAARKPPGTGADVKCEEALLEAFGQ